jgi:enterochelin esterase-like enzyme
MAVVPRVKPIPLPATAGAGEPTSSPAYIQRGRDLRIDFLRGLCVIAMIADHVAGSSWLYTLTGGNRFYTSAAEGFVFVSGLVAGRAYTRFIARDGLSYGLGRVLGRAGQLYLLAVCLALAFAPVSEVLHLPWALGWNLHQPLDFVVGVLTLHRTYYLVDVMLLYVLLLVTASVALVLCTRGQSLLVLGASWLLWLLYQVFPDQVAMPWPIVGNNLFYFPAWQVLFFTGLVIGHSWETGTSSVADKPRSRFLQKLVDMVQVGAPRRRALVITGALLACAIAFYSVQDRLLGLVFRGSQDPGLAQATLLTTVFGKSDLRLGRLVAFALVFVAFFLATTEWWPMLRRWLGWLVLPLGQNALFTYSAHVAIAAGVAIEQRRLGTLDSASARENAAFQLASILVIWALVRLRLPARVFSTRQVGLAAPVLLAAVALVVLPRVVPEITTQPSSPPAASAAPTNSAAAVVAQAYGTVIPANAGPPTLAASASDSPVPQPTANPTQTVSSAAGRIQGTLLEPEFHSAALNTQERLFIYLPPGYQTPGRRFPVLYMLHGGGGRREWIGYGLINMADQAISSGAMPPMVIVLPQGDESYWVNHNNGGPRWGDYLAQDVVSYVDANYPTQADAKHRAIGGMSMGGWGALYQAFTHPEEFGTVGAHAPSLRSDDGSMPFLPRGAQFSQFDPLQLASNAPGITSMHIWVDADKQDPWVTRDAELHTRLEQRHITNEWNTYPGQHGGSYWHDHVQDYLKFYAKSLSSP